MNAFVVLARVSGSRGLRKAELPSITIQTPGDRQREWRGGGAAHFEYIPEDDKIN
jgi:hypothetical protein